MSKSSTGTLVVRELMSASVITVPPTTTVGQVLDLMFERKILALPVVENEQCIGIVTSTDLVVLLRSTDKILRSDYPHYDDCLWAVDLVQKKLDEDPVREIMSEVVMTTTPDTTAAEVAEKMLEESVHHVPVVDDDGKLVGFLSSFDFLRGWSRS
jgi:CBS domain-containing protein